MAVSVLVALAAQFVADHYASPAMLMALLFGMALNFLGAQGPAAPGIAFTSRAVLRFGVAILGARISAELLMSLGWGMIALLVLGIAATIGFGLLAARVFGQTARFAVLTAGSVAICGASAAMAIAAILPKTENSERNLLFTVLGVTVLSTAAMILYPILTHALGYDDVTAGAFIGGTVHDVAQVVGAGFSISDQAGETSTLVKLIRVSLLAPVVVLIALWHRNEAGSHEGAKRPPVVPGFVLGFLALATLNSLELIPEPVQAFLANASGWALIAAIAAVGMKTDVRSVLQVGGGAIALIVAETLFLAVLIFAVTGLAPVLNVGSSSLKVDLASADKPGKPLLRGAVERTGGGQGPCAGRIRQRQSRDGRHRGADTCGCAEGPVRVASRRASRHQDRGDLTPFGTWRLALHRAAAGEKTPACCCK